MLLQSAKCARRGLSSSSGEPPHHPLSPPLSCCSVSSRSEAGHVRAAWFARLCLGTWGRRLDRRPGQCWEQRQQQACCYLPCRPWLFLAVVVRAAACLHSFHAAVCGTAGHASWWHQVRAAPSCACAGSGNSLAFADLSGQDLRKNKYTKADLRGADFRWTFLAAASRQGVLRASPSRRAPTDPLPCCCGMSVLKPWNLRARPPALPSSFPAPT
jgi:hypothetical protein